MTDRDTGYDAEEVAKLIELLSRDMKYTSVVSEMSWVSPGDTSYWDDFRAGMAGILRSCVAEVERLRVEVENLKDVISRLNYESYQLIRENGKLRQHGVPDGVEWPRFEDGEPVRIGDYIERDGDSILVKSVTVFASSSLVRGYCVKDDISIDPSKPIMHPPIYGKDGHPITVGQTVYGSDGRAWEVTGLDHARLWHSPKYNVRAVAADGSGDRRELRAGWLTHESPDSWERLEADAETIRRDIATKLGDYSPSNFEDGGDSVQERLVALVGRARALAGCEAS